MAPDLGRTPDEPDGEAGAIAAFEAAGVPTQVDGETTHPLFNAEAIAAALVDRAGRVTAASPAFAAMGCAAHLDAEMLARAAEGGAPVSAVVELPRADTAIYVYGRAGRTGGWRLPPEVAGAAAGHPAQVVVLTSQAARARRPLEDACRAYGFSGLQTRVALETVRTGHVKAAAEALDVSYNTAREALAEAMKRAHVARLPALVQRLASHAFGVLPQADIEAMLGDLWGLTPRQAAIAGLVADGLSRAETAAALELSAAVVKKELDRVYLMLQTPTAAALARKLVEARALSWMTRATGGDLGFVEAGAEPLQFVYRGDGSRIALSDYGPASGRPILYVHSAMTSRTMPRGLLRALQAAGFRPVAIDRPGFGLSDPVAGTKAGAHDCYATAAADAVAVLDQLKIRDTDLVARGGAQAVVALARAAPGRLKRVVLVNPDPHFTARQTGTGVYRVMKAAYWANPAIIRFTAEILMRQITLEAVRGQMQRSLKGSRPDEAAIGDPEIVRDYFRAQRGLATGSSDGVVNEQTDFARGSPPPPLPGARWQVLVSAHDTMHDPAEVLAYWRKVLPDARFRVVEDAGRLLAMSHPQYVVAALAEAGG